MRRVAVIGSPGAGKSTFAVELGRLTGLPVIHLDREYWRPGWIESPREDWLARVGDLVRRKAWVMDGNYGGSFELRLPHADTVIFLDPPRWRCLLGAVRRAVRFYGRSRPDMGEGCPEKIDLEFLLYIWRFKGRGRANIRHWLAKIEGSATIHHLESAAEMTAFLSHVDRASREPR